MGVTLEDIIIVQWILAARVKGRDSTDLFSVSGHVLPQLNIYTTCVHLCIRLGGNECRQSVINISMSQ